MTQQTVTGFTTSELIEVMMKTGVHCSLDAFRQLAIEIQQRALKAQDENKEAV